MLKPTAFVLLAALAAGQAAPPAVPRAEVKRLAERLNRLDPGGANPFDTKQLAELKKFLDANPHLKREVDRRLDEFKRLPPAEQGKRRAELDAVRSNPQLQEELRKAAGVTVPPDAGPKDAPPDRPAPLRPGRRVGKTQPPDGAAPPTDPDRGPPADAPPAEGAPKRNDAGPRPAPPERSPGRPPTGSGKGFERFVRLWEENVGPLKDTPAVKQLASELFRGRADAGPGDGGPLGKLIDGKTADDLLKGLPEAGARGGWSLPDLGGAADALPSPSLPGGLSGGGLPSAGGAGLVGGLLLLAGLVVLAVWLLPKLTAPATGPTPVPGLGPWPLDPQTIRTRADLVRAFEYLSVLLVGSPARAFSHEAAAAALRAAVPAAADAAGPLADAYALARYTPADHPLTDADLLDARRLLCRLAGVPAP